MERSRFWRDQSLVGTNQEQDIHRDGHPIKPQDGRHVVPRSRARHMSKITIQPHEGFWFLRRTCGSNYEGHVKFSDVLLLSPTCPMMSCAHMAADSNDRRGITWTREFSLEVMDLGGGGLQRGPSFSHRNIVNSVLFSLEFKFSIISNISDWLVS